MHTDQRLTGDLYVLQKPVVTGGTPYVVFKGEAGWGTIAAAVVHDHAAILGDPNSGAANGETWVRLDHVLGTGPSAMFRCRADLFALADFAGLAQDSSGIPCVWRRHFACNECDETWEDDWSCQCDDTCACGSDLEPDEVEWIGPPHPLLIDLWEALPDEFPGKTSAAALCFAKKAQAA